VQREREREKERERERKRERMKDVTQNTTLINLYCQKLKVHIEIKILRKLQGTVAYI